MTVAKLSDTDKERLRALYIAGETSDADLCAKFDVAPRTLARFVRNGGWAVDRSETIRNAAQAAQQQADAAGDPDIVAANAQLHVLITEGHRQRINRMKRLHDAHLTAQLAVVENLEQIEVLMREIAANPERGASDAEVEALNKTFSALADARQMKLVIEGGEKLIDLERVVYGLATAPSGDSFEDWLLQVKAQQR